MASSSTSVKVYEHASNSAAIKKLLSTRLPDSITLLRRVQHRYHPASAHIYATFSPTEADSLSALPKVYAIVLFDRYSWSGVSAWVFWSGEMNSAKDAYKDQLSQPGTPRRPRDLEDLHLLAVIGHLHSTSTPNPDPDLTAEFGKDPIRLGCVHGRTYFTLASYGLVPNISLPAVMKYLFTKSGLSKYDSGLSLPAGLIWDTIQPQDAERIMETNPYMRNKTHLDIITGVGVRVTSDYPTSTTSAPHPPGALAAWGFLGLEGSVRTLHVEEAYRRLGLAKKLVIRLVREKLEAEYGPEDLCDAEIFPGNDASTRLFEGLGAFYANDVYWIPVDLDAAEKLMNL